MYRDHEREVAQQLDHLLCRDGSSYANYQVRAHGVGQHLVERLRSGGGDEVVGALVPAAVFSGTAPTQTLAAPAVMSAETRRAVSRATLGLVASPASGQTTTSRPAT